MKSHLKVFGHPLHPMLVVFPLGLLVTSVIYDALWLASKKPEQARTAQKLIGAGILGGLAAAGLVDYAAIPSNTRAKRIGFWHGSGNALLLALFGASWKLRQNEPEKPSRAALGLSLGALLLGNITTWLGGELVYRLGIGVDPGANFEAPDSLSHS
ncbi:putative membrane protein [Abditibacterium utsteinense]|uniref:Putative membrane protein n=1 Tax=Abditibacterium utsteinense TaxID=1960156 RepID=A0A2S8SXH8_9BACT|nr:DUF2231 domain-containing protein [Abditibacterium utsteinense]PQV65511.1 putative membrane protein [Abditibacterium utsteinense]